MAFELTNKAITFLVSDLSSVATTLVIGSGEGDKFPSPTGGDVAPLMFEDRLTGAYEIAYLTGRTGDTLTISRGQEGTISASWPVGSNLSLRATAAVYESFSVESADLQDQINALVARLDDVEATAEQRKLPIGSVISTTNNTNPGTSLGYGTWTVAAAGRALVGVGNNGQATWSAGEARGNETHTLSSDEMPNHQHWADPPETAITVDAGGDHNHVISHTETASSFGYTSPGDGVTLDTTIRGGNFAWANTNTAGSHAHTGHVNIGAFLTDAQGSGQAHNNVQPSLGVYYWQRTA